MGIAINRGINQASDRKGAGLRGERKVDFVDFERDSA